MPKKRKETTDAPRIRPDRAPANRPPREDLEGSLAKIQAAAGGVLEVCVISPRDAAMLMARATDGDAAADRLLRALGFALRWIETAPEAAPALCGVCPTPLRRGDFFRLALALPYRDDPRQGLAFGICRRCATTNAEAHTQATRALQNIWTCSRPFDVTHPGGGMA
jgi:hypothetical protein